MTEVGPKYGPWEQCRIWRPRICHYCYKRILLGRCMRHVDRVYLEITRNPKALIWYYQHEHCVFLQELK